MPLVALKNTGAVDDRQFDRLYPEDVRDLCRCHFTPVAVARSAATFLVRKRGDRILDVGSGAGKFCVVGALTTEGRFVGVEQRRFLVDAASQVVKRHRVDRVSLVHGNMTSIDWREFQGFYLYNPFAEQIAGPGCQIDEAFSYSMATHAHYVEFVRRELSQAPAGTRVATYQGFGGEFPDSYRRVSRTSFGSYRLDFWLKDETA